MYDCMMVDVEDEIAELAGTLNVVNARLVALVEHALETGEWRGARIHRPAQWLAWRMGLSAAHARQIVAVAERRSSFPRVTDAFGAGELSLDQVSVVVTRAPAWADANVVDFAKAATVHQLQRMMRSEHFEGGEQPADDTSAANDRLSTGHRDHGRWRIHGDLANTDGSVIDSAIAEVRDDLFRLGNTDVTNAEALVELARRYLDNLPSKSRRDRYRVWLHLDADAAVTLTGGWRLPDAIRDQLLCDGVVQPVWERDGVPFSVGRNQHIVPERTRRAVMKRDRGCRVPGCTADRYVEVHHILHWKDGGPTDTSNLLSLCPRHHRLHHRNRLGITGNADENDGVRFTDEHGRLLDTSGRPTQPTGPPPTPSRPYEHPEGTPLDRDWIGLGWVHPEEQHRRRTRPRAA